MATGNLFVSVKRLNVSFTCSHSQADVRDALLKRMTQQTLVQRGKLSVVRKGQTPAVQISTEKRQGNKRVTRIVGVEAFLVEPEVVAAECQRKFATASSVGELPGKGAGKEVLLQGDLTAKVADHLMAAYGIPKKYFQVKAGK